MSNLVTFLIQMDDPSHLEKFNHDCSRDLQVNGTDVEKKCSQNVDFLLVIDLEGKVEILEFPVLFIDAKSLSLVDFFHRFPFYFLSSMFDTSAIQFWLFLATISWCYFL